jgi:hypothetical protein
MVVMRVGLRIVGLTLSLLIKMNAGILKLGCNRYDLYEFGSRSHSLSWDELRSVSVCARGGWCSIDHSFSYARNGNVVDSWSDSKKESWINSRSGCRNR